MIRSTRSPKAMNSTSEVPAKKLSKSQKQAIQEKVRLEFQGGVASPQRRSARTAKQLVETRTATVATMRSPKRNTTATTMSKRDDELAEARKRGNEWAMNMGYRTKFPGSKKPSAVPEFIPKSDAASAVATKTPGTLKSQRLAEARRRAAEWAALTLPPHDAPMESPSIKSEESFSFEEFAPESPTDTTTGRPERKIKRDRVGEVLTIPATKSKKNTDKTQEIVTGLVAGFLTLVVCSIGQDVVLKMVIGVAVALLTVKLQLGKH